VFTQWWLADERPSEKMKREDEKGKGSKKKKKKENNEVVTSVPEPTPFRLFPFFPLTKSAQRMILAGIVAGMLPLVHAHTFIVVMTMGGCLALIQRKWRDWFAFFIVASLIAVPQMLWSTHGSSVKPGSFFDWQFGWDRGTESATLFWLKNTGLFIPLIIVAILWPARNSIIKRRV